MERSAPRPHTERVSVPGVGDAVVVEHPLVLNRFPELRDGTTPVIVRDDLEWFEVFDAGEAASVAEVLREFPGSRIESHGPAEPRTRTVWFTYKKRRP